MLQYHFFFSFNGFTIKNLEKIAININKNLIPELYFDTFSIDAKSPSHWAFHPDTTTLFLLKFFREGFWTLYVSSPAKIFFNCPLLMSNFPSLRMTLNNLSGPAKAAG